MKTGRFLRVWTTSIFAHSANVVNIILPKEKGKRIHSSFLSSSMGGKKRKEEAKARSLPGANFGTVTLHKRIGKWKCVPLK